MKRYYILIILLFLTLILSCNNNETQTGCISGFVNESTSESTGVLAMNNPIIRASVTIVGTKYSAITDLHGEYRMDDIPVGSYDVSASATGYTESIKRINIVAGEIAELDFTLQPIISGNTFYVSPSGNDSNSGSKSKPWLTPSFGVSQLLPGDTLIILGGKYILKNYPDDIISPPSGSKNKWIKIRGENGNRPKIVGENDLVSGFDLSNTSYVIIENIELKSNNRSKFRDGIATEQGSTLENVVLKNLYIHHIDEFGINFSDVNHLDIINCKIEYCGFGSVGGPAGYYGGWKNVIINNCSLSYGGHYYQGGDGSNRPYDRPDGFGIEPSDGPVEIFNTIAQHNYGDGIDSKSADTFIHHCIVANNTCDGIKLWRGNSKIENTLIYGTGDGDPEDSPWAGIVIGSKVKNDRFEIINVTLNENSERKGYPIYVQYDYSVPINLTLCNSIIANGYGHAYFGDTVNLTAEYNIFYMPTRNDQVYANGRTYIRKDLDNGILGEGNIYGNPEFIKPAWGKTGDYHVKQSSPAVDTGTSENAPPDDLDHKKRPQGNGYDKGAYEK